MPENRGSSGIMEHSTTRRGFLKKAAGGAALLVGRKAAINAAKILGPGIVADEAIRGNIPGQEHVAETIKETIPELPSGIQAATSAVENIRSPKKKTQTVSHTPTLEQEEKPQQKKDEPTQINKETQDKNSAAPVKQESEKTRIADVAEKVKIRDSAVTHAYEVIRREYGWDEKEPYVSGGHPIFYLENPDALKADIVNANDFLPWYIGDNPEKPAYTKPPELIYNHTDPQQEYLATLAQQTIDTMMLTDRQRLTSLLLGSRNNHDYITGKADWLVRDAFDLLPDNPGTLAALIHELSHASVPRLGRHYLQGEEGKFYLATESGSYPTFLSFQTMWMDTISNNLDFFQERFFNAKGDELLDIVHNMGYYGLLRANSEAIAMLCADLIIPSEENMHPDEWPNDIKTMVAKTWNFIRHGEDSHLQPISDEEVNTVRERILGYYTQYKALRAAK